MLRRLGIHWILLAAAGIAASGAWAAGAWTSEGLLEEARSNFPWVGLLLAVMIAVRRLTSELRDIARDRIAYSQRPLASGKVRPETVWKWVGGLTLAALALSIFIAKDRLWAGVLVVVSGALIWLSAHEFYMTEILPERPALRGFLHPLVALPLSALAVACFGGDLLSPRAAGYALLLYGATVSLSLSRTLDPKPHHVWPTVVSTQGSLGGFTTILAASAIAAWGARLALASRALGVFEWALVVVCAVAIAQPSLRRIAGAFGVLSFFAHAWAGPLVLALRALTRK